MVLPGLLLDSGASVTAGEGLAARDCKAFLLLAWSDGLLGIFSVSDGILPAVCKDLWTGESI